MLSTRNLAILIFDDVEVLDFCGPFEVFSVANRFTDPPAFRVFTVAQESRPILARGGLSVNPHYRLTESPQPDLLLVTGGQGTRREMNNPVLIDWLKEKAARAELILSVCTGALVLAKAGLLDGLEATTHHGWFDLLRQLAPNTQVHEDRRYVDNGRVICSAGIAAGIDMSLHVVSRLSGRDVAVRTARQIEYPWEPQQDSAPGNQSLTVLEDAYAICRLDRDAPIPAWASAGRFISFSRTPDELSIVCPQDRVAKGIQCVRDWRCLRVVGPIDLSEVGVLAALLTPLAEAGVSVFTVSTFDTDYLLVKAENLPRALDALRQHGHVIG
jgi:putative intracellular protease/amidase